MKSLQSKFLYLVSTHSIKLFGIFFILTFLICFAPAIFEDPGVASLDPKKEAYEVQQRINEKFVEAVQWASFVIEADDGDMIDKNSLSDLLERQNKLIELDSNQELTSGTLTPDSFLWKGLDETTKRSYIGTLSIANVVDGFLRLDPKFPNGIYDATDDDIKITLSKIFSSGLISNPKRSLSKEAKSENATINGEKIVLWTSPVVFLDVLSDNAKLGGGNFAIELGGNETTINKEKYARRIQDVLNSESPSYKAYGIAIDVNLEAQDEGAIAGQFITATVIAAIAVSGIFLRSYVAMVLIGVGLVALMIWLKGLSFALGFKGGLISDLIVPIAMVSFGVDFAIHAIRRIQEERSRGVNNYFLVGMTGVLGALTLALLTDSTAFIANAFGGVESVVYFGVSATLATFFAYLVLGILVPLGYAKILPLIKNQRTKLESTLRIINFIGTPLACGFAVIVVVVLGEVIEPSGLVGMLIGLGTALVVLGLNLALPIYLNRRSKIKLPNRIGEDRRKIDHNFAQIVTSIAKRHYIVLPLSIIITIAAGIGAFNLKSEFDVKDFFDNDSSFVLGLDKFERYSPGNTGEPAQLIFEGDITDQEFLVTYKSFLKNLSSIEFLGKNDNGDINQDATLNLEKISQITLNNPSLKNAIEQENGVLITDNNNDGIPDTKSQMEEIIKFGIKNGFTVEGKFNYNTEWVKRYLWYDQEKNSDFTSILLIFLSGTRTEEDVARVRKELNTLINKSDFPKDITIGITGSPFSRSDQLNASTDAMRRSIPIAAVGSFLIVLIALKSFKYAIATIIPIGLVVVWLYGIMYVFDFSLNYVTATIGAISLGVGVDFSIHMTMRFREEINLGSDKHSALFSSINGTGLALLGSALSSMLGFAIMGFAPMPLFSTFGILTAIMIGLALTASLFTLPSLLFLVSENEKISV
ncbi:MAG: hypothetical protein CL899_01080 [Dehalococcoidia bacterium]|nr:hypothetical protein [Dehalococcoidia bacterium]